ncbi:MAG: hypothetical protein K1X68_08190 [Saprospiraceae bacterium]|nr:hypothetical protein [Saprospiraceae bacterium]HMX88344.1 hypothetical protein [Saprospiraceae bacterium]HMZ40236.1 hypothetical protein [Saprospiraceae bacterium]HNB29755.1 hypothetical protein [Saprospiraceae bacterium]HNC35583.1 hypothetical protein [Saprospiraceae bacterium]
MKLRDILSLLDRKELNKLRKYLCSDYFCTDPNMIAVLDAMLPELNKNGIPDKQKIWKSIFGQKPYEDVRMRLLMSRLFGHVEKFLRQMSFEHEHLHRLPLRFFRHHAEDKLFLQALDDQKQMISRSPIRNESFYDYQYSVALEEYDFLVTKKRQGEFNIKHISDSIEIAYCIKKLRHCCRVLQIHSIYKLETPFPFIEEILQHIEKQQWTDIPVLGFYYYNYQSILHPLEPNYFERCVEIYNDHEDQFEEEERRYAFIDILNYCIRKLNEGSDQYYEVIFNLYNRGLDQGFLLDQGKLSRFTYRNIAEIGILMKNYDWVLRFLDRYKLNLERQYRDSFYQLEKARVLSDQRNYSKAIELLANLGFSDPLIELSTRLERIRIFFEMDELEVCQYHIESMELFLRRKKHVGYHTEYYKNFISYARKLLRPEKSDIHYWRQLRTQIDKEDKITGRKWLIEKYDHRLNQMAYR